jgi:hypothetical protein
MGYVLKSIKNLKSLLKFQYDIIMIKLILINNLFLFIQ